ncbi:hypothetical protein EI94DRAFT_1695844 [Lactarius quietus]|nr:hypothetical protein EI94DRAFT_1695837 [Lactarius quietus]KAF8274716.1 hypothetical protein EI94DRAFT_1695844 [Lactarius quietus]
MHFMHGFHGWEGYNGHFGNGRGAHDKHFLTEELPELSDWPTGGAADNLTWAHWGAADDVTMAQSGAADNFGAAQSGAEQNAGMSIPDYNLTKDEETLHHYAATLEKRLEAYHACESRDENAWVNEFKVFLVRSMVYFTDAISRSRMCPRVHPLFLSLTEAISQTGNSPDISTVSENDPRALRSNYYTAPTFSHHWIYISMAKMAQDNLANTGDTEMNVPSAVCNLQNALSQHKELSAEATDATVNIPRNGKKCHSAPSDKCKVLPRQLLQDWQQKEKQLSKLKQLLPVHPRGKPEMLKMSQAKANGKQTKKIDSQRHKSPNLEDSHNESWQDEPVPIEESSNRRKDGGNEEGFLLKVKTTTNIQGPQNGGSGSDGKMR